MGCKNVEKRSSTNFFLEKCKVETIRKKLREKLKWIVLFVGMNLKEAFEKNFKKFYRNILTFFGVEANCGRFDFWHVGCIWGVFFERKSWYLDVNFQSLVFNYYRMIRGY